MGLNIKNDEVEADIRRLAEITGESLTTAVQVAVRERMKRVTNPPPSEHTLQRHLEAARIAHEALEQRRIRGRKRKSARELIDDLYDEHGLPK